MFQSFSTGGRWHRTVAVLLRTSGRWPPQFALMGTLKYMAPEVYAGKQFSSNIDTYSLGLVMYELLDSRSPVSKEAALYQRFSGAQLPRLPRSDEALQSIIMKACAYKPEDRFSSATEMLNELLKIEGGHGKESESM